MTNKLIQQKIEEFKNFGFINKITGRMDQDADTPHELISWLEKALQEARLQGKRETINNIRNWTKGKAVTKDKLRNYLNFFSQEQTPEEK